MTSPLRILPQAPILCGHHGTPKMDWREFHLRCKWAGIDTDTGDPALTADELFALGFQDAARSMHSNGGKLPRHYTAKDMPHERPTTS